MDYVSAKREDAPLRIGSGCFRGNKSLSNIELPMRLWNVNVYNCMMAQMATSGRSIENPRAEQ